MSRWLLLLMLSVPPGLLEASVLTEPRPFNAEYRLEIRGWPNATIDHRLSRENGQWQSRMQAAIVVASGNEQSRFYLSPKGAQAVSYASGYSLLGIGAGNYRLDKDDLATLPDRQTALFELSRQARVADCTAGRAPCELRYLDHKGEPEHLEYRVHEEEALSLPAGVFQAVTIETWESDSPENRLVFHFHPDLPGLMLAVEYHREGETRSRLTLTALEL
ncbi:hypothetical protein [Halomonas sp.]|uniref:hypothetical protein n=1 Tax=Halomonas sp. TaxID=1486246 RepID=UPI0035681075